LLGHIPGFLETTLETKMQRAKSKILKNTVLWSRIRMDLHWFGSPRLGARKLTKVTNRPDVQPFKKAFVPAFAGMFYDLLLSR
jgi:hypothetical protein